MVVTRILGIDPGSVKTGYGIIDINGSRQQYIESGCIRCGNGEMPDRLHQIFQSLEQIIREYQPRCLAIETVFMHKNADSAIKLGQARGAAICACMNAGLSVAEYSPRQIKQSVVGTGAAAKNQVQQMVTMLLSLSSTPQEDAADALAVALCHANSSATLAHIPAKRMSRGRFK